MNLVEQAEADLSFTLEDKDTGFGISVVLIDGSGTRYGEADELIVQSTDIGFRIDPQTGVLIVGRTVEINLRLSTLLTVTGGLLPGKITGSEWKAELTNTQTDNQLWTFVVREGAFVDRKLGIYKLTLDIVDTT